MNYCSYCGNQIRPSKKWNKYCTVECGVAQREENRRLKKSRKLIDSIDYLINKFK